MEVHKVLIHIPELNIESDQQMQKESKLSLEAENLKTQRKKNSKLFI